MSAADGDAPRAARPESSRAWATGIDAARLAETSRRVAKIGSAAVQDGYELCLHGFMATASGRCTQDSAYPADFGDRVVIVSTRCSGGSTTV